MRAVSANVTSEQQPVANDHRNAFHPHLAGSPNNILWITLSISVDYVCINYVCSFLAIIYQSLFVREWMSLLFFLISYACESNFDIKCDFSEKRGRKVKPETRVEKGERMNMNSEWKEIDIQKKKV